MGGGEPWLGRYRSPERVFETRAFRFVAVKDRTTEQRRLVVHAVAPSEATERALASLARAHAKPSHPVIARVDTVRRVDGASHVVFDTAAHETLSSMLARGSTLRVTHAEADGFIVALREALIASGRPGDGGEPASSLGFLSLENVFFADDGSFVLLGLGHNVCACDADGRPNAGQRTFVAPEVARGEPPSASADFVAVLKLARALISYVELDSSVLRCLTGNTLLEDMELAQRILFIERQVIHAEPGERAGIAQTIRTSDRIRELIGVYPDVASFRASAARHLGARDAHVEKRPLSIARDGTWFERPGVGRVDLASRPVLARLLSAVAEAHLGSRGAVLGVDALLSATWPGERIHPRSGANRVYVSVNALRKLGLGPDLERHERGYRLASSCVVVPP